MIRFLFLLALVSCVETKMDETTKADDYALVEFAAKLEKEAMENSHGAP